MAITNARTGYLNGTTDGWGADCLFAVGSAFYAVVLDTSAVKIRVYKSTDGGSSWTEQDGSNALAHVSAIASYTAGMERAIGSDTDGIYIAYRTTGSTVRVRRFDTSTDTYDGSDIGGGNATTASMTDHGIDLSVRSDGDMVLTYVDTVSGTDHRQTYWNGSAWGSVNSNAIPGFALGSVVGDDDIVHSFAATASATYHQPISTSNTRGTRVTLDATASALFRMKPGYVNDGGTHRIACLVRDSGGEWDFRRGVSSTNVSWTLVGSLSPTSTSDPGIMGGVLVPYNSVWYAIWSGDGRGSIHMDLSDDFGTPTFGTDTDVITGLGNDPVVYAIPTATGIPVMYTDLSGPTVDLIWAVGSASVDATGTVTAQNIAVGGSTVTGSDSTDATGTVTGQDLTVTGSDVTGSAGADATGTVAEEAITVAGSTVSAFADFEYLGQDSVINAIGYASARAIRQLTEWDGVVWLGHGDIGNPSRPLRSRYWDPSDSSFHTTSDRTSGYDTDGLNTHFIYNDELWLPFNDVTSTGDYAVLTDKDTSSVIARASMDVEHLWWMTEFSVDGYLYAAGSDNDGGYAAVIWQSTDGGSTWTEVFRPTVTNGYWFTAVFELGGLLWTQAYDALGGNMVGNAYSSDDGTTWTDEGFDFYTTNSPLHKVVSFGDVMFLRATPTTTNSGKLWVFDGSGTSTDVTSSIATETGIQGPIAKDVSVLGDVAYALGTNRVSISMDGVTWTVIGEMPSTVTASSVLATPEWIYVGTTNSQLWRMPNPVGYVDGQAITVTGSDVTGDVSAGATGTVEGAAVTVTGSDVTGSAGAGATATVTGQDLTVAGSDVTGSADVSATGTVTGEAIDVTGSDVTVQDLAALPTILGRMHIGEAFAGRIVINDVLAGSLSLE